MSIYASIGYPVYTDDEYRDFLINAANNSLQLQCPEGVYLRYTDNSGTGIFCRANYQQELLGAHPHFLGISRRRVSIAHAAEDAENPLDGGFLAWAEPTDPANPESGLYPFFFKVPDYKAIRQAELPVAFNIQLTAFALPELTVHENEAAYNQAQTEEVKYSVRSFIPSGLFKVEGEENNGPVPIAIFSGFITQWEKKTNSNTGRPYYWLLVDTLGGPIDVVVAPELMKADPQNGNVIQGQFWLSGLLMEALNNETPVAAPPVVPAAPVAPAPQDTILPESPAAMPPVTETRPQPVQQPAAPAPPEEKKGFWKRLFGK